MPVLLMYVILFISLSDSLYADTEIQIVGPCMEKGVRLELVQVDQGGNEHKSLLTTISLRSNLKEIIITSELNFDVKYVLSRGGDQ